MNTSKVKILIIDDHQLFREGMKRILELEEDFIVVAKGKIYTENRFLVETYRQNIV